MIEVLGPLRVLRDGVPVDIGSPRHREVLAALVVEAGRVVSTDALLERVWGEAGRGASTSNLHAIISRLRARLRDLPLPGGTGLVEITTASPGYRLDAAGAIDALAFLDRTAAARAARAAGDLAGAHDELEAGMSLWRGPAYADIALPFAEVEAARLDGLRLAAVESLVDAELALGRHAEALERLPGLVAEHPVREGFRHQLMLALYRSGRQAEALEVYADVRAALADELGIDPGPELRELHQRILGQDQELLEVGGPGVPASSTAVAAPEPPGPRPDEPSTRAWHSDVVVPADRLLGREQAVEYLRELLSGSEQRLVTVTGVGGVGKTRLAYAVADACRDAFPDGVVVVSLAPVADPAMVLPAIGRASGLSSVEGLDPVDTVVAHLRARRALLVLDNLEHLLEAAPALATLVRSCPRLSVLVTSRAALRVRGELQYQLPPLTLPAQDAGDDDLAGSPAVALFVDRARAVVPDFGLDAGNAPAVAAICRRLDGIPLALELAAARSRLLDPEAILARLDQVMAAQGARDLPARQRTMRAAIDWSYQLLEPADQRLFRLLAVFAGGFTLDAAEAVVAGVEASDVDVMSGLETLVEHSLVVRVDDPAAGARFRMLEPVAQFATACLGGDEERAARDAHLHHFLAVAERTEPAYRGAGTIEALALTERERANLVAALEWAQSAGHGDLGGRLVWAMWLFWWLRGHVIEGRRLVQGIVDQEVSDWVRVRALAVLGAMSFAQGDLVTARSWLEGAELGEQTGDVVGCAHNVAGVGLVALGEGDLLGAVREFRRTVVMTEEAGLRGEWLWTLAHIWQATVLVLLDRADEAAPLLEVALDAARSREDPLAIYIGLFTSARVSLTTGDPVGARRQLEEGILLSLDTGDMANLAYFLEALAVVEAAEQAFARVALLHGAASRLRATVGSNVYGYYQPDEALLAESLAVARTALGDTYDELVARGGGLDLAAAVALATGDPADLPA